MIAGLHHVAVSAVDFDQSLEFYRDHFGLDVVFEWQFKDGRGLKRLPGVPDPGPMVDSITGLNGSTGTQCMLRASNCHIELFGWSTPTPKPRPADQRVFDHGINHVCFQVNDLDAWHRRLSNAGVQFTSAPHTFPRVKNAYAMDPDGNLIELIEPLDGATGLEIPNLNLPAGFDPSTTVEGVHHVGMSVINYERTMGHYRDNYDLEPMGEGMDFSDGRFDAIWQTTGAAGRAGFIPLPNAFIEVFEFTSPAPKPRRADWVVADHGYTHFSFQMPDVEDTYAQLVANGVRFNCPPILQGRVIATYAHEADGNLIEFFQPLEAGEFLSIAPPLIS